MEKEKLTEWGRGGGKEKVARSDARFISAHATVLVPLPRPLNFGGRARPVKFFPGLEGGRGGGWVGK